MGDDVGGRRVSAMSTDALTHALGHLSCCRSLELICLFHVSAAVVVSIETVVGH